MKKEEEQLGQDENEEIDYIEFLRSSLGPETEKMIPAAPVMNDVKDLSKFVLFVEFLPLQVSTSNLNSFSLQAHWA